MNYLPKLLLMCLVLYLIRAIPFFFIKGGIKNRYIRSFLAYVPYVTLSVMTFPAIVNATGSYISGCAALAMGLVCAYVSENLFLTATLCCLAVLIADLVH